MGIINQEVFVNKFMASAPGTRTSGGYETSWNATGLRGEIRNALRIEGRTPPSWYNAVDRESALQCFEQIKDYIVRHGYLNGKLLRPWFLDAGLTDNLDRSQVWWGWEFETGYISSNARAQAISHCWDNYDGVVFDAEGEGNAAVEITFTPEEEGKFRDGTGQAMRFMQWVSDNRSITQRGSNSGVGTHLNMSHPGMTPDNVNMVANGMNRTVGALEQEEDGIGNIRHALFGRSNLYGGFYPQNMGGKVWTEGKLFRTTYSMTEFQRYLRTGHGLSRCLEAIVDAVTGTDSEWRITMGHVPLVSNLFQVINGEAPVIRWTKPGNVRGDQNGNGWELSNLLREDKTPQTKEEVAAELARLEEEKRRKEAEAAERARLAALEAAAEVERRAMHARNEVPTGLPEGHTWCDDCGDWHED